MRALSKLTVTETEVPIKVDVIEKKYNAKYVGDLPLVGRDDLCAIFWQPTPPENYSEYFGILVRGGTIYITDASSVVTRPIYGLRSKSGEVLYSRFHHDFRYSKDGSVFVDGGADYFRRGGDVESATEVQLKVVKDEIFVEELR